jgi:hypothetical protein
VKENSRIQIPTAASLYSGEIDAYFKEKHLSRKSALEQAAMS